MKVAFIYAMLIFMTVEGSATGTARAAAMAGELRELAAKFKRRLQEQVYLGDLTLSQVSVLGHLMREGPSTVSSLARAERMRPQSMGATVAALEQAGLVSRTQDPNDGRQTILSLTPACLKRIKAGRAAKEDWLSGAIQSKLSQREQDKLEAAIELLKRIVDS